ncbi:MAG: hypothetical protein KGN80_03490, partial [Acidobacteriota bacterium]|nr:hypothetical protein [Acidobacteriota bacterium]
LLFTLPVFLVLALLLGRKNRVWAFTALIVLVLGTAGIFMAAASGEAAGKLAERSPEINAVLERHEHLAEAAQGVFSGLALAFAALLLVPIALKRELPPWAHGLAHGVFLLVFLGSLGFLVQIAHQGGRLVHQYGVHALMAPTAQGEATPATLAPVEADRD